jgi:hypothetical protein
MSTHEPWQKIDVMKVIRRIGIVIAALLLVPMGSVGAQQAGWDATGLQLTRAELQNLLATFEETSRSTAYSNALREQAEREADLIRSRLAEGDMRIGDRVLLIVEGQPALTDTFSVVAGRMVVLPEVGQVTLDGILRSELQAHLTEQIGRFIREPVVQVRALVRIQILGAVAQPGFYPVPSDLLITDVLMLAGGPVHGAKIEEIEIRRGEETIWEADALREALIEGRTLDQLSVRAGDGIHVPVQTNRLTNLRDILYIVAGVSSLILLVVGL